MILQGLEAPVWQLPGLISCICKIHACGNFLSYGTIVY